MDIKDFENIKRKIEGRDRANRQLLFILGVILKDHPELRFGQVIHNFKFVGPEYSRYVEEPVDVLARVLREVDYVRSQTGERFEKLYQEIQKYKEIV